MQNVRVMMVARFFYPHKGGAENQCLLLGKNLVQIGVKVNVITEYYSRHLLREEIIDGVRVRRCKTLRYYFQHLMQNIDNDNTHSTESNKSIFLLLQKDFLKRYFFGSLRILNEYTFIASIFFYLIKYRKNYDLIHGHQANWIAIPCAWGAFLLKKPVLIKDATLNGLETLRSIRLGNRTRGFIIKHSNFIAMSTSIYENLLSYAIPKERIHRCPNGVEVPERRWEMPRNSQKVLFIGNFWQGPIKGLDVLIRAMNLVVHAIETAELIVAGEGDRSRYKDLLDELQLEKKIIFLGRVEDVTALYLQSSVFVLPSRQEGMSNVLLEAMAIGMPCVVTNVSGSNDLVMNGIDGLLVESGDVDSLANAIVYMLKNNDDATKMGEAGRNTIEQNYEIRHIAERYKNIYDRLVAHHVISKRNYAFKK